MKTTPASKRLTKSFVASLRNLQKDAGLKSNRELAAFLSVPDTTLGTWLRGKSVPSIEAIAGVNDRLVQKLSELQTLADAIAKAIPAQC